MFKLTDIHMYIQVKYCSDMKSSIKEIQAKRSRKQLFNIIHLLKLLMYIHKFVFT